MHLDSKILAQILLEPPDTSTARLHNSAQRTAAGHKRLCISLSTLSDLPAPLRTHRLQLHLGLHPSLSSTAR